MTHKLSFVVLLVACAATQLSAQINKERIRAFRTAIITEELQLTDKESAAFFPIYEAYDEERKNLQEEHQQLQRQLAIVADAELIDKVEEVFQLEEEQIQLRRTYFERFVEVLPIRKVVLLHRAERQFKKQLLEKIKERRGE